MITNITYNGCHVDRNKLWVYQEWMRIRSYICNLNLKMNNNKRMQLLCKQTLITLSTTAIRIISIKFNFIINDCIFKMIICLGIFHNICCNFWCAAIPKFMTYTFLPLYLLATALIICCKLVYVGVLQPSYVYETFLIACG